MASTVDVLRFIITGDNKGLLDAAGQTDQALNNLGKKGQQSLDKINNGFANAFKQRHRNLIDATNQSIIQLLNSMIPLGAGTNLAVVGLSRFTGILGAMSGGLIATAASLSVLGLAFLVTKDKAKELREETDKNAEALANLAKAGDQFSKTVLVNRLAELNANLAKELAKRRKLEEQFGDLTGFASDSFVGQKFLKIQNAIAAINGEIAKLQKTMGIKSPTEQAAEDTEKFIASIKERIQAENDLATKEALMDAARADALKNIVQEERARFALRKELGEQVYGEELAFLEQIRQTALKSGLFDFAEEIKKQMDAISDESIKSFDKFWQDMKARLADFSGKQKQAADQSADEWERRFRQLLDASHRLASEFGRFMSAAVENFLHTAIDAISEIRDSVKQIKIGGLAGAGGLFGFAGTVFGVIGSIADMFSSGTEVIRKSNLELIGAIREWISNLRGLTKEEIGATRDQISKIKEQISSDNSFIRQIGDANARLLDGFDAVAALFQKAAGRPGTTEEILNFWLTELQKQGSTFGIIASGLKSLDEVKAFLKDQTKLDFQTGRQFIEFFSAQNKFTPEQQKVLFEDLLSILQASGNITTSELIDLTELIRQLSEGQSSITEEALKDIQITRSVASITENQANLVVGFLQTIAAATQRILEVIETAVGGLTAVPFGGGTQIQAGAIVINAGAQSAQAISAQLITDLRAKGVKV